MRCHSLLQEIFLTQGLNLGLLHCRQMLYHLSHQGSFGQLENTRVRLEDGWKGEDRVCLSFSLYSLPGSLAMAVSPPCFHTSDSSLGDQPSWLQLTGQPQLPLPAQGHITLSLCTSVPSSCSSLRQLSVPELLLSSSFWFFQCL